MVLVIGLYLTQGNISLCLNRDNVSGFTECCENPLLSSPSSRNSRQSVRRGNMLPYSSNSFSSWVFLPLFDLKTIAMHSSPSRSLFLSPAPRRIFGRSLVTPDLVGSVVTPLIQRDFETFGDVLVRSVFSSAKTAFVCAGVFPKPLFAHPGYWYVLVRNIS